MGCAKSDLGEIIFSEHWNGVTWLPNKYRTRENLLHCYKNIMKATNAPEDLGGGGGGKHRLGKFGEEKSVNGQMSCYGPCSEAVWCSGYSAGLEFVKSPSGDMTLDRMSFSLSPTLLVFLGPIYLRKLLLR